MKKIKIIDLLNKIANGEEVPKRIKYNNKIYIAKGNAIENFVDYCNAEDEWCFNHYVRYENLNDEVEILEDEKKMPEKIDQNDTKFNYVYSQKNEERIEEIIENITYLRLKTNEILDYLKSKGDD